MRMFLKSLFFTVVVTMLFCSFPPKSHAQSYYLYWTAVGDDGNIGTAMAYDMRRSLDSLSLVNEWDNQDIVVGVPVPSLAGERDSILIVSQPTGITYYYSIRAVDENYNWSQIGNIFGKLLEDTISPASIIDLRDIP